MPVPLLIVELPASDVDRPETATLLEACTAGLGAGRCEVRQGPPAEAATAVAVVAFRGPDHLSALVEVGRRSAEGQAWLSDELAFQPSDPVTERFRALGLTMATLFRELEAPKASSDPSKAAKSEAARPAPPPPSVTGPGPAVYQLPRWLSDGGSRAFQRGCKRDRRRYLLGLRFQLSTEAGADPDL
jgi:hypothetical protein